MINIDHLKTKSIFLMYNQIHPHQKKTAKKWGEINEASLTPIHVREGGQGGGVYYHLEIKQGHGNLPVAKPSRVLKGGF